MPFKPTSEHHPFLAPVRGFADNHLKAGALARAHQAEPPWDVAKLMAEQGLMCIAFPEADGGQGGTLIDAILAIEAVTEACPRSADVIQAGNFGPVRVLAEYGTSDQKQRYLAKILRGESVICVGMTEPEAGSAVTDLTSSATPDGGGYWLVSNIGTVFRYGNAAGLGDLATAGVTATDVVGLAPTSPPVPVDFF